MRRPRPDSAVKINAVVRRGERSHADRSRAHFRARRTSCASSSSWTSAARTAGGWTRCCRRGLVQRIHAVSPRSRRGELPGEVARRYRYRDGAARWGHHLRDAASAPHARAHGSPRGSIYTCLFAAEAGADLRAAIRSGATDEALAHSSTPRGARARSLLRAAIGLDRGLPRVEMSYIGG